MSSWLFNLCMHGVVREVQARTLGRGAQLVDDGEESCYLQMTRCWLCTA